VKIYLGKAGSSFLLGRYIWDRLSPHFSLGDTSGTDLLLISPVDINLGQACSAFLLGRYIWDRLAPHFSCRYKSGTGLLRISSEEVYLGQANIGMFLHTSLICTGI
jgi:6-pyruvoyl-tetrahydropterin synthase